MQFSAAPDSQAPMDKLKATKTELISVERSIEAMRNAVNFEIFEKECRVYLNCIEQILNKVERS